MWGGEKGKIVWEGIEDLEKEKQLEGSIEAGVEAAWLVGSQVTLTNSTL